MRRLRLGRPHTACTELTFSESYTTALILRKRVFRDLILSSEISYPRSQVEDGFTNFENCEYSKEDNERYNEDQITDLHTWISSVQRLYRVKSHFLQTPHGQSVPFWPFQGRLILNSDLSSLELVWHGSCLRQSPWIWNSSVVGNCCRRHRASKVKWVSRRIVWTPVVLKGKVMEVSDEDCIMCSTSKELGGQDCVNTHATYLVHDGKVESLSAFIRLSAVSFVF